MATYRYSIATDFASAASVAVAKLDQEIRGNASILTSLSGVTAAGDYVDAVFNDALTASSKSALDAVVAAHDGVAAPDAQPNRDDYGNPVFAPSFLSATESARLRGYGFTATAGALTFLDVLVTSPVLVQGGQFWIQGAAAGDYVDCAVVDKLDTLGLFATYGLVLGTDVLELVKYVDGWPLPAATVEAPVFQESLIMPTVAPIQAGLHLRLGYSSAGATDVRGGILYREYEAPA